MTMTTKKRIRAIPPAAAEIPPKPNTPATTDMMKNSSANLSIAVAL
jgi:hypothetical protein